MSQGEVTLVAGGGSQTSTSARWGDYSSMNVDPVDDCTFWYTTEYYATWSSSGWRTWIGSFKFPSCGGVAANGSSITYEGFVPANLAMDPGERVTVSLTLINNGPATGAESPWVTSTTSPFGGANAAFAPDPATAGHTELVTPAISVPSSATQLSFKNNYNTESSNSDLTSVTVKALHITELRDAVILLEGS